VVEIHNSASLDAEKIIVRQANDGDVHYAITITNEMEASAKARGTGIAKRSPDYVALKMREGKSVIAHLDDGTWVGFCYIEAWGHGKFVANSGLIVAPAFRKTGVATQIKRQIFNLSRSKYPESKIFGLTTGLAVMKMNSEIGYVPVTYSELTDDEEFWAGCRSCVNYEILQLKERKNCLCTAMLYDPAKKEAREPLIIQATYAEKEIPLSPSQAVAQVIAAQAASPAPAPMDKPAVEPAKNFDRILGALREKISKLKSHHIL
jgi:hypothetical protein